MASYRVEFTPDGTPVLVEDDVKADRQPLGQIIAGDSSRDNDHGAPDTNAKPSAAIDTRSRHKIC